MDNLTKRSAAGFDRAKGQLEDLLEAGEINKLDARLVGLLKLCYRLSFYSRLCYVNNWLDLHRLCMLISGI